MTDVEKEQERKPLSGEKDALESPWEYQHTARFLSGSNTPSTTRTLSHRNSALPGTGS